MIAIYNTSTLTLIAEPEDIPLLQQLLDAEVIDSYAAMYDFLEPLTCNTELEWVSPAFTGDLTEAPMLGIYGETVEDPDPNSETDVGKGRLAGCWNNAEGRAVRWFDPVDRRWAFMDYQLRSVLRELLDKGQVRFISGLTAPANDFTYRHSFTPRVSVSVP